MLILAALRNVDIRVIMNAPIHTAMMFDFPPAALVPPTKHAAIDGRKYVVPKS